MIGEFALIRKYFSSMQFGAPQVLLGPGDDCALLKPPASSMALAISTDTLNAGVHFPADASPGLIASRALRVNLSDLAAMGAQPYGFSLALSLPEADPKWLAGFAQGLRETAAEFAIPLLGGDTTRGDLSVTISILGQVNEAQALCRSAARPGDAVYLDGSVGDGGAALALLESPGLEPGYLQRRFYQPQINFELSRQLPGHASAAIDVSDGLLADLGHIAAASGVAATIDLEALPVSEAAVAAAGGDRSRAQHWALTAGDDYRLCFTVPADHGCEALLAEHGCVRIGGIVDGEGVRVIDAAGAAIELPEHAGYQHFRAGGMQ